LTAIPISDVTHAPAQHFEAPYQRFITASLTLGIGGGFLLSLLLPLARLFDWQWGATQRWAVLVQIHGQLQLIGFAGLFVMGMALRIMPRISGRRVAFSVLVPTLIPTIAGYLLLRSLAQPLNDSTIRDVLLIISALLLIVGSFAFSAIVWGTLLHSQSRAGAAGWFFCIGAVGLCAAGVINLVQTIGLVRDSLTTAPGTRQLALVFVQQFGFLIMFVAGVGSRAIATLTGQPRRELAARLAALAYTVAIVLFAGYVLVAAEYRPGVAVVRAGMAGFMLTGVAFFIFVWISGALTPGSRVAAASRLQFWFVRSAFAWMVVGAVLILWFGARAFNDASPPDQFELDAVRHVLTVGVLMNILVGMAMLIVPEFAGRRLQHPNERWPQIVILASVNSASAFRLWPGLEGTGWISDTRYWPVATSAALSAVVAVILFAAMFSQSWWEQRDPEWARDAVRSGASRVMS
jgi:hypothetical protein